MDTIFIARRKPKMSKSVGVFARNHFSVFSTSDRFGRRFGLRFEGVWAPFWEVFRGQERKSGARERVEKQAKKDTDTKSREDSQVSLEILSNGVSRP